MKKSDLIFLLAVVLFFLPFFACDAVYDFYKSFNKEHGMIMAFIKFAILATLGEVIGLRIRTGKYNAPAFGIIPRAIVWGFLGLTIKMAFKIFAVGAPAFMEYMGVEGAAASLGGDFSVTKLITAFAISVSMNTIYAPVMMTFHKITDMHIMNNGGTVSGLLKPIKFAQLFQGINWDVQWNFVFKKTIPFFWFPMHTITFMLPEEWQILFAAALGIALGVILSIANQKK